MTADDPRFSEWLSRKPGKKKIRQERAAEIFGGSRVAGVVAEEVARKAATAGGRVLRTAGRSATRAAAGPLVGAARAVGAAGLAVLGAKAAAAAAAGALAYFGTRWAAGVLDRNQEDREQRALSAFVAARNKLVKDLGASSWGDVPASLKAPLVAAYQQAVRQARAPRVLEK